MSNSCFQAVKNQQKERSYYVTDTNKLQLEKILLEKSLKLENAKKKTSFIFMQSFAVERGPKHFFGNHENDGTFDFFSKQSGDPRVKKNHMEGQRKMPKLRQKKFYRADIRT